MLKFCRTPGPTACLKLLQKVCLKRWRDTVILRIPNTSYGVCNETDDEAKQNWTNVAFLGDSNLNVLRDNISQTIQHNPIKLYIILITIKQRRNPTVTGIMVY